MALEHRTLTDLEARSLKQCGILNKKICKYWPCYYSQQTIHTGERSLIYVKIHPNNIYRPKLFSLNFTFSSTRITQDYNMPGTVWDPDVMCSFLLLIPELIILSALDFPCLTFHTVYWIHAFFSLLLSSPSLCCL